MQSGNCRHLRDPAQPSATTQVQPEAFTDTLPAAIQQQNPTGDVTYSVEVLNRDHRGAGLSNRVSVPAAPTLRRLRISGPS